MSKKRTAETDLNHDNWADEEEPDQPGEFRAASEEQMSQRKVIRAKRRNVVGASTSENLFSSFKGFSNTPTIQSSPGTFDFLKMLNKPSSNASKPNSSSSSIAPPPDLISVKPVNPFANILGNNNPLVQPKPDAAKLVTSKVEEPPPVSTKPKRMKCDEDTKKPSENSSVNKNDKSEETAEKSEAMLLFEERVKVLNIKFVNFIHEKIKANPCVILFPPLDDYRRYIEKYLRDRIEAETTRKIEKEGFNFNIPPRGATCSVTLEDKKSGTVKTLQIGGDGANKKDEDKSKDLASESKSSAGFASQNSAGSSSTIKSTFSFGSTDAKTKENGSSEFKFGKSEATSSPTASFSFSASDNSGKANPLLKPGESAKVNPLLKPGESTKVNFSFSSASKTDGQSEPPKTGFLWGSSKSSSETKVDTTTSPKENFFGLPKSDGKPSLGFSWGAKKDEKTDSSVSKPSFAFGTSSSLTKTDATPAAKPFSFGFANAPPAAAPKEEEDEDEVLPKEEVKEIVEEDSIFNIKCKIFVMKPDKSYGERGVGNLFVKSIEDKVKGQVIVRTETDTGKIIFNIVVNKHVPLKREKNNLIVVTIPHPTTEKNPKPVTCLIRVKTAEDAEKLLECLEKFKN